MPPVRPTAVLLLGLLPASCSDADATGAEQDPPAIHADAPATTPPGMVWIPGGRFRLGSSGPLALVDERDRREVAVSGFFMDVHEVSNDAFAAFVEATGHVTTAERVPTVAEIMEQLPPGTPPPDPSLLVAGSLVFRAPPAGSSVSELSWWHWVAGADWRHPTGPGSDIEGRGEFPVVHVSWDDAVAYARWAGKQLPSEAQWEWAARGGQPDQRFGWGDEQRPGGRYRANWHQGGFPFTDKGSDGFAGLAPVGQYPPNPYGLHDMFGNVWEWTADWYRVDRAWLGDALVLDPTGPTSSHDPAEPTLPKRTTRGGSFLCNDGYCLGYRPTSRMKTSPDTSLMHTGFRCVMTAEAWAARSDG